ncbi:MAG: DUF1800 domain-containing protein, partial [Pseudomonadales bacterium]|nr:DUF1800 domain-containing protein [Pseudomonadales bacterium]
MKLTFVVAIALAAQSAFAELDLAPIDEANWNAAYASHLLSRSGFGGSPEEIAELTKRTARAAVTRVLKGGVDSASSAQPEEAKFEHSGVFEPGLDPFPPSRPATTRLAKAQGHALGVNVKASGNRPLQPVVNKFFYWLRASRLETDRVAYWWAERMLTTDHPLQDKLALFWHGHFATNEDKVRDYRKMLLQLETLRENGLGNFRELLISMAQDPAMLVFLDAGVNTKDSPNENFAREIMELFTMGVGNYSERDVQEAARAFTGWNVDNLSFHVDEDNHDTNEKRFLGQRGSFDGVEVVDIILAQPATGDFIASKLYRYFVNEDLDQAHEQQLGNMLRSVEYDVGEYLSALFLSRDFYASRNMGSRIKSPVEMVVSTYRKLGLDRIPGVPDFNIATGSLGQRLMHPPTVAGWSEGRSWITPSLMFERANFALDVLFPDIGFIPPDRYPFLGEVVNVQDRLRQGMSIAAATKPTGVADDGMIAASNLLADRDEAFNTRLGSMRGWQMAIEKVRPIPRTMAAVDLAAYVQSRELGTPEQVVDNLAARFFSVTLSADTKEALAAYLVAELGSTDVLSSLSFAEEALRKLLHRMLSLPEYQLG